MERWMVQVLDVNKDCFSTVSNRQEKYRPLLVTHNASGAAWAASQGLVVVIVDVIDMSTTAEAVMEAGAIIWGASPDVTRAPVEVNPEKIGYLAGLQALEKGKEIVLVSEPRIGAEEERRLNASKVLEGVARAGVKVSAVVANQGAETIKLLSPWDKVVIIVSDTGGVSYDAAFTAGAPAVLTGTVARTKNQRGIKPKESAAQRAIKLARELNTGIAVVAASAMSFEDISAAEEIAKQIIADGFLSL